MGQQKQNSINLIIQRWMKRRMSLTLKLFMEKEKI